MLGFTNFPRGGQILKTTQRSKETLMLSQTNTTSSMFFRYLILLSASLNESTSAEIPGNLHLKINEAADICVMIL